MPRNSPIAFLTNKETPMQSAIRCFNNANKYAKTHILARQYWMTNSWNWLFMMEAGLV